MNLTHAWRLGLIGWCLVGGGEARAQPAPSKEAPLDFTWLVEPGPDGPRSPPPAPTPKLLRRGDTVYRARCAVCHGEAGDGRGYLADRLIVPPTNFTRGVFKLRSTPPGGLPTDDDLFVALTRGVHGTSMTPWRALPEIDRWALVFHLKSLSPRFAAEPPPKPILVPVAPPETETLRDRGEVLYGRFRCVACHGESGAGNGPARAAYLRSRGRDVRIRDFTRGRFLRGTAMEDVFLTLRIGIEGTPMGAYDGLPDADLWALASYVRFLVGEQPIERLPPARRTPAQP
jgi:cytochrome c oxidase cbb3-type subunit 2